MKLSCLAVLALGACTAGAYAQATRVYRPATPAIAIARNVSVLDAASLLEPAISDAATGVFGYPGKRLGLENVGDAHPFAANGLDRDLLDNRAWGISLGMQAGPVTFRIAHQNKNVAKIAPAMPLGNRMDAKNSTLGASIDLGPVKAYTAYSANRGWGSSPLWNPDNPYGASMASIPSTDSRDVLVGLALPLGHTTLLASVIRKNDRDLANRDADQFAFGGTYSVSSHTDFYTAYSLTRPRSGAMAGTPLAPNKGSSALNLGMRHSF